MAGASWDDKFRNGKDILGAEPSEGAKAGLEYFKKCGARSVLDVACGYGKDSVFLAKEGAGKFEVTGIDFSAEGIRLANERAMGEGVHARFLLGDVRIMQFPDASFDAVLCNDILTIFIEAERRAIASEVVRVLGHGGALAICEPSSTAMPKSGDAREVERGTFVEEGKDHMRHYFLEKELESLFAGVKFEKMENMEKAEMTGKKIILLGRKA